MIDIIKKIKKIITNKSLNNASISSGLFNCPVCRSNNISMNPLSMHYFFNMQKYCYIHNIFYTETLNLENYNCTICGASDRDRLYALYLDKYFISKITLSLLDIAPAFALRNFIKSYKNVAYRSMDLYMQDVDDNIDITKMDVYCNGQFDMIICSHVLEHIPNDLGAMAELFRILKLRGKAIIMVPINLLLEKTLEDPSCSDVPTRWKYFGQDDHIRAYSKADFIERLKSVGFKIELLDINYFGKDVFEKNAILPSSVLYIVSK